MIWHFLEVWLLLAIAFAAGCALGAYLYGLLADSRLAMAQGAPAGGEARVPASGGRNTIAEPKKSTVLSSTSRVPGPAGPGGPVGPSQAPSTNEAASVTAANAERLPDAQ